MIKQKQFGAKSFEFLNHSVPEFQNVYEWTQKTTK
jgi:hypothetical protein